MMHTNLTSKYNTYTIIFERLLWFIFVEYKICSGDIYYNL